jgi:hypothetical protein
LWFLVRGFPICSPSRKILGRHLKGVGVIAAFAPCGWIEGQQHEAAIIGA